MRKTFRKDRDTDRPACHPGRGPLGTYATPSAKTKMASLVAQTVKRLSAMQETRVQSLGWEDPLEKEMAAHCSILAWKIPWTVEPGRLTVHEVTKSRTRLSDLTCTFFLSAKTVLRGRRPCCPSGLCLPRPLSPISSVSHVPPTGASRDRRTGRCTPSSSQGSFGRISAQPTPLKMDSP